MEKQNRIIHRVIMIICLFSAQFAFADEEPQDSVEQNKDIIKWEYNLTSTERTRVKIDTTMDFFYLYEPNGSIADYKVHAAEYASPAFSLLFTPKNSDAYFLTPYESSLVSTYDIADYTAQRPFSELFFSQGLNSEQSARFLHTQNANKYCNVGLNLNFYKTMGEWDNQSIKGQHVTPWIAYYGPRFSTTFKYAFNNIKRGENGGIAADSLLHYEKLLRMKHPRANSFLRYQDIAFTQKWNLGRKPKEDSASLDLLRYKNALGYRLNYNSIRRGYTDNLLDAEFYTNILYDSTQTADTVVCKSLTNAAFIEFQRKLGNIVAVANFAVGAEFISANCYDYAYKIPESLSKSEYYEGQFSFSLPRNISIEHSHLYYFEGDDSNSFELNTSLSKLFEIKEKEISISLSEEYSQSYLGDVYYVLESNHNAWRNDFSAEKLLDVNANITSEWGGFEADVHYYTMKDYISFDTKGVLQQSNKSGNALTAKVQKTTRFWHFLMKNGLIYQDISVGDQEYPTWATYNSLAVQGAFFHKLIHFGLGAEVLYYPAYNVPTFDAALGDFLPQTTYKYGNFPIVNAFATLKYKPIKLYVKYNSLYALLKEQNYPIAGYPQTNGTISFGISWLFYN